MARRISARRFITARNASRRRWRWTKPICCRAWLNRYRDWFQENVRPLPVDGAARGFHPVRLRRHGGFADRAQGSRAVPRGPEDDEDQSRSTRPSRIRRWCYQLAAYRKALGVEARCINLIVNSVVPETPIEHVWGETEMDAGLRAFMAARELWVIEKGYDPGASGAGRGRDGEMVLTA